MADSGILSGAVEKRDSTEEPVVFGGAMAMIELMGTISVLKRWKENPALTKREIGVWWDWIEGAAGADVSLTDEDIVQMKAFVQRVAPSTYAELFPE
jgi:hypothetical protein